MTDSDPFFIDSNILIYAYDKNNKEKYKIASKLIANYISKRKEFYISNQVLSELYYVLTNKIKSNLNVVKELIYLFVIMDNIKKLNYSQTTVLEAIDISNKYSIHYLDSLIIATMLENEIYNIYTENIKDFSKCEKINAINPFEVSEKKKGKKKSKT